MFVFLLIIALIIFGKEGVPIYTSKEGKSMGAIELLILLGLSAGMALILNSCFK
jgi:hypothetical protein